MNKGFLKDISGNVAIPFGIALLPMFMAVSSAIDYSQMSNLSSNVQQSLDGALISVAKNYSPDANSSALDTHGQNFLNSNLSQNFPNSVSFEYLGNPTSAQAAEYGIKLDQLGQHLLAKAKFTFKSAMGFHSNVEIVRHSVVAMDSSDTACVLTLDKTASRAVNISGNTSLDVSGCTIAANSESDSAIYLGGSGTLSADCLHTSGGISASNAALMLNCKKPVTKAATVSDPYSSTLMPKPGVEISQNGCGSSLSQGNKFKNCEAGDLVNGILNIKPGTYSELNVKDKLHLEPGEYIINGAVKINAKANITGTGVTLFLGPNASLSINGGASVNLIAPTAGTYQGFVIATLPGYTKSISLNGNSAVDLTGIIYAPEASDVKYSGNNSVNGECIRIVAKTVTFSGSSKFKSDCKKEIPNEPLIYSGIRIAW